MNALSKQTPLLPALLIATTMTLTSAPLLRIMKYIQSLSLPRFVFYLFFSHYIVFRLFARRILPFIAQRLIDRSNIVVTEASIENPRADRLMMRMKGMVTDAGPLPATISFNGPVQLAFEEDIEDEEDDVEDEKLASNSNDMRIRKRMIVIGEADDMPPITAIGGKAELDSTVQVRVTNPEAFGQFSKIMMQSTTFSLTLIAPSLMITSLGLPIHHVTLKKTITMKGLQSLPDIKILTALTKGGTKDHILLSTTCEITNPSDMTLSMGDVSLSLLHDSQQVGTVFMNDMILKPGKNTMTATAHYAPKTTAQTASGRTLLAQYVTGKPSTVTITGSPTSSPYVYLLPALESLHSTTTLPGEPRKMIIRTHLVVDPFMALKLQSATKLVLFNPMDAPITVLYMTGNVTCRGEDMGTLNEDLVARNEVIVLPPTTRKTTGVMGMKLKLSRGMLGAVLGAMGGEKERDGVKEENEGGIPLFEVDVESTIGCLVGEYRVEIDYRQEGVPVLLFG